MCQKFSRRFAVYEMVKFTLEENWKILKTLFQNFLPKLQEKK